VHGAEEPLNLAVELEAAPDVSRETTEPAPLEDPPALSREQVIRLEALTAIWERQVRLEGPADATMLWPARSLPPVPPPRSPNLSAAFQKVAAAAAEAEAEVRASLEATQLEPAPTTFQEAADAGRTSLPSRPAGITADTVLRVEDLQAPPARVSDWTSRHDPRSLQYAVRDRLRAPVPVQDVLLAHGPILDQGTTPPLELREASACTGTAAVAAANVLGGSGVLGLEDARRVYFRAQDLDELSGHAYAGTSVLAVMKAGQEAGWWDTYLWGLGGTRDVAQALLQLRVAVVLGLPWSAGLEVPDAAGIITPGGSSAGGHALAAVGLQRTVAGRPGPYFVLQQSRGAAEGVGGLVYLHHRHLSGLLAGHGEAAIPLREPA
jgi:hypothetical protein